MGRGLKRWALKRRVMTGTFRETVLKPLKTLFTSPKYKKESENKHNMLLLQLVLIVILIMLLFLFLFVNNFLFDGFQLLAP